MDENQQWFLMKHDDGSVFGPVNFEQLRQWAEDAQISPLDKVSVDESTWVKAPMVPELNMDYLVEVSTDQYYGPTTLGAVREFLLIGEINSETSLTNCANGVEMRVSDLPQLQPRREEEQPVRTSIRLSLQKRIRELEEALMDERRARENAELRCERLEARLAENSAKHY
jgi:hypothetical protein